MAVEMAWTAEAVSEAIDPGDVSDIRRCMLDYFEGWFDGNPERMDRALHPGLAKHSLGQDPNRTDDLDLTTKEQMVAATRDGVGRSRDVPDRAIEIDIVGVAGGIASVIVHSAVYVEYALLARTPQGWQITGTLWCWATGHGPRAV